jgi:adenosine deaminase
VTTQLRTLLNALQSPLGDPGIAKLVIEIMVLGNRLEARDEQSEYFQWSIQSHLRHYYELLSRYDWIRREFNQNTSTHFRNEISAQVQRIRTHQSLTPLIARKMLYSSAHRTIQQMEDMIRWKKRVDKLPAIDDLKKDTNLLEALFALKRN